MSVPDKPYPGRFAAIYAALALVAVVALAGAVALALTPATRAKIQHVQQQLGTTDLTRLADKAIAQSAQQQGFAVVKIRVLRTVVKGDDAVVTARVTVTDGASEQTVTLKVALSRSVWTVQGMTSA